MDASVFCFSFACSRSFVIIDDCWGFFVCDSKYSTRSNAWTPKPSHTPTAWRTPTRCAATTTIAVADVPRPVSGVAGRMGWGGWAGETGNVWPPTAFYWWWWGRGRPPFRWRRTPTLLARLVLYCGNVLSCKRNINNLFDTSLRYTSSPTQYFFFIFFGA